MLQPQGTCDSDSDHVLRYSSRQIASRRGVVSEVGSFPVGVCKKLGEATSPFMYFPSS